MDVTHHIIHFVNKHRSKEKRKIRGVVYDKKELCYKGKGVLPENENILFLIIPLRALFETRGDEEFLKSTVVRFLGQESK